MLTFRKTRTIGIWLGLALACLAPAARAMDELTDLLEIDPAKFSRPTIIDNKWLPLKPGTLTEYTGTTVNDEGERQPHRIVSVVTDLVKKINGIDVVVIWERDIADDILQEAELTFFAQDDDGNVWHFGQYSEGYDGTEFLGGMGWMVGHLDGAKGGIMMQADPKMGTPSYSEGYGPPPFNWTDRGQVSKMGEKVKVPVGSYDDVLVIEEWSLEEAARGASQFKYYAQGVGNIKVGFGGDDVKKELLELTRFEQLSPEQLEEAHAEALKLDARSYIYGSTEKARRRQ